MQEPNPWIQVLGQMLRSLRRRIRPIRNRLIILIIAIAFFYLVVLFWCFVRNLDGANSSFCPRFRTSITTPEGPILIKGRRRKPDVDNVNIDRIVRPQGISISSAALEPIVINPFSDVLGREHKQKQLNEFTVNIHNPARVVASCSNPDHRMHRALASSYVLKTAFNADDYHPLKMTPNFNWNVWLPCGTQAGDRMIPDVSNASTIRSSIVLNIPGKTPSASKSGLWQGLVAALGEERASSIVPKSFMNPITNLEPLLEYAKANPDVNFIFKTGRHRQKGVKLISAKEDIQSLVNTINPSIVQVSVETLRKNGRRTAFRTYVWIRCTALRKAVALIDWISPGYVAATESDFVASGYTPNSRTEHMNAWELIQQLLPDEESRTQMILAIENNVSLFLEAFQSFMCDVDPSASNIFQKTAIQEMFGFDWIPVLSKESNKPHALLLEANRFPDMSVTSDLRNPKDWIKVCTVLRRLSQRPPSPDWNPCYVSRKESAVEASGT